MNKKANLRQDLDAWRGVPFKDDEADGFDITKLLDKFCKIQVVHNVSGDKTYANVGSIMTTKKTAEAVNEIVGFSVADPDMEVFEKPQSGLKLRFKNLLSGMMMVMMTQRQLGPVSSCREDKSTSKTFHFSEVEFR